MFLFHRIEYFFSAHPILSWSVSPCVPVVCTCVSDWRVGGRRSLKAGPIYHIRMLDISRVLRSIKHTIIAELGSKLASSKCGIIIHHHTAIAFPIILPVPSTMAPAWLVASLFPPSLIPFVRYDVLSLLSFHYVSLVRTFCCSILFFSTPSWPKARGSCHSRLCWGKKLIGRQSPHLVIVFLFARLSSG